MMLYKIAANMKPDQFHSVVLSIKSNGNMAPLFASKRIPVFSLGMNQPCSFPVTLLKLKKIIDKTKPDLIQGWMYHGNLFALMGRYLQKQCLPVVWNIRHSIYDIRLEKKLTQYLISLGAMFSSRINSIIYNATTSAEQHEDAGFSSKNRVVIPNGFDTRIFRPHKKARAILRDELNLADDSTLIGMIARYHQMKDHATFLQSAKIIRKCMPQVKFLLVGTGVDKNNSELQQLIQKMGLDETTFLLGERSDISIISAALDVACLSSYSEGFPNTLGEAMACGVPCVATDVGDTASLVGSGGRVVPAQDPNAFANAVMEILKMTTKQRRKLADDARNRILQHYRIENIVRKYEGIYLQLVGMEN